MCSDRIRSIVKGASIVKTDLESVRDRLEARLKSATTSRRLNDSIYIQQVADPADMTQEAAERDVAVQILERESTLARQLRSALDRIKDGSYGFCLECEEEIPAKRLQAIPWAELCVRCQEKSDSLGGYSNGMSQPESWPNAA
jgi:RNA polymerase-binding transcription factor